MSIGAALRHYRGIKDWKREDLASRSRVGYQTIALIEQGHRLPSVPKLKQLAEALEVSIDDLVYYGDTREWLMSGKSAA